MPSFKATAWKWLIVGHRWLGVATCLLFAMWFASGLVLMYVGFPELTRAERLSLLQPIEWNEVRIAPERVLHGLALGEFPQNFRLEMMAGEPVYRVEARGWPRQTLSATTGRIIEGVDARQALAIVRTVAGDANATVTTLERDQWTVAQTFEGHRPLHRVALDDLSGAAFYVSSRTGEIVLDTTSRERGWNWVGAVIHWLYFTPLRKDPPLWSQVVMWISGVGIVVAFTGLWLGIDRLRVKRRNGNRSITPFRGWMAWHHVAGIVGGVFVLTWIFSGWMSMGPPVPWEREFDPQPRMTVMSSLAGAAEPDFPATIETLQQSAGSGVREASFMWALGEPQIVLTYAEGKTHVIDARSGAARRFTDVQFTDLAGGFFGGRRRRRNASTGDAYWYSEAETARCRCCASSSTTRRRLGARRSGDRQARGLDPQERSHQPLALNALHSFDYRWILTHRPSGTS